ncbi:MAG: hypothetical protein V4531_08185 [Actinomycetota bacterium]
MTTLVDVVETEFDTDFAILTLNQSEVFTPNIASFAFSAPGLLRLECGTKYPRVRVRVERWDSRPPLTAGWDDVDELPFEEIPAGGELTVSGFDPGDVGLDIDGLGRARVQVLARGRHRYSYGSHFEGDVLAPEAWLMRLYTSAGPIDPMAGGPRRIAGGGGLSPAAGSPWKAAVLGYRMAGWADALGGSEGFRLAEGALLSLERPLTRAGLAKRMVRWMPPWEAGGPDSESMELPRRRSDRRESDPLETVFGRGPIVTIGDAIDALVDIGLLLVENRAGQRLLVPNPSPERAWEHLGMTGEALVSARSHALDNAHARIATDIASAVDWVPTEGVTATLRSMAIRWSTTVEDVLGGIRLLGGTGRVTSDRDLGFDAEIDPDETLVLRLGSGSRKRGKG